MRSLAGLKVQREPAGEAKPDVCVISDGKAGAYCTVGLVLLGGGGTDSMNYLLWIDLLNR